VIGPYKLLQQLGEGGMGTVYLAEQSRPVRRLVALKIIKPGMDSRQVVARFEAERQALALMDHPNIARVLDGGTTESGRPFFVMELVKGVPLTKYCDDPRLTPRQRLELFLPVCHAVQHAHQKGIIHRDLKPSNVMVCLYDGRPVPKVIDFGIAKATGQKLTERTMFTEVGQVVGTLEYMSPEQAELNQLDIDTRSDIYSLGVLLYELLTGSKPLDRKRLKSAALLEVLRLIREEEPPRPSTRLSESQEALPSVSAQRQTEPAKLARLVRGELDWIVMKALEKDRSRRYETANGFALNIQRYLADEPVLACPPTVRYRLQKFVFRNRGPVLAATVIVLLAIIAIVGTTLGLPRSQRSEEHAQQEARQAKQGRDAADGARGRARATAAGGGPGRGPAGGPLFCRDEPGGPGRVPFRGTPPGRRAAVPLAVRPAGPARLGMVPPPGTLSPGHFAHSGVVQRFPGRVESGRHPFGRGYDERSQGLECQHREGSRRSGKAGWPRCLPSLHSTFRCVESGRDDVGRGLVPGNYSDDDPLGCSHRQETTHL
jgi:serine/threonine protein kinase